MKPLVCFLSVALFACKPDPLADYKKECRELAGQKVLKAGLSIDDCAKKLAEDAALNDPARKADELVDRITRLVGSRKADPQEVKDAVASLQAIGKPATAPALAKLKSSGDGEVRIALAKALVGICADDCATSKYDCIVPALLEGTTDDKPSAVRIESEKGLTHCTGEQLGDDPAAWRKWWAAKEKESNKP